MEAEISSLKHTLAFLTNETERDKDTTEYIAPVGNFKEVTVFDIESELSRLKAFN